MNRVGNIQHSICRRDELCESLIFAVVDSCNSSLRINAQRRRHCQQYGPWRRNVFFAGGSP